MIHYYIYFYTILENTQSDDEFLHDLKAVYKSCAKKSTTPVTVSILANKYLEAHSEKEYKKKLNGRKLKSFLSKSKYFTCTGDHVTIAEGIVMKGSFSMQVYHLSYREQNRLFK